MRLSVYAEAGATTCDRCRYLGAVRFGQTPVCLLFPAPDSSYTVLDDGDGRVMRCEECIAAERRE